MQIHPGHRLSRAALSPPLRNISFGHGGHDHPAGQSGKRASRLKRWMLAEVLGGTLLIFSTPFLEPVVDNLINQNNPVVVQEAGADQADQFCRTVQDGSLDAPRAGSLPDETVCQLPAPDQAVPAGDETAGKIGVAALLSGLFALFHYGMHAVSGGLFYKFGRHKAEEEMISQGRNFEGIRELLHERLGQAGEDYSVISAGDEEIILRRRPRDDSVQ